MPVSYVRTRTSSVLRTPPPYHVLEWKSERSRPEIRPGVCRVTRVSARRAAVLGLGRATARRVGEWGRKSQFDSSGERPMTRRMRRRHGEKKGRWQGLGSRREGSAGTSSVNNRQCRHFIVDPEQEAILVTRSRSRSLGSSRRLRRAANCDSSRQTCATQPAHWVPFLEIKHLHEAVHRCASRQTPWWIMAARLDRLPPTSPA